MLADLRPNRPARFPVERRSAQPLVRFGDLRNRDFTVVVAYNGAVLGEIFRAGIQSVNRERYSNMRLPLV